MTEIIIFEEKHSNRYYIADTQEKRAKAFLDVLRERAADYYREPIKDTEADFTDAELKLLALSDEEVYALPDVLKEDTMTKRSRLNRRSIAVNREYKMEKFWWDRTQAILAMPEEKAIVKVAGSRFGQQYTEAEDLIDYRGDYQYEGYQIVSSDN